jgi:ATP-binding cassette subfamily B protein
VQQSISSVNEALENCFSGIRVVKAFTAEPYQRRLVGGAIEGQRQAEIRAVRWQTVVDSLYGHVWQFATVGVLLAGGHMAIDGRLSLGELVAFDSYVLLLVWPMFDVGNFLVRGRLSAVSIDRISELEETMPDVRSDGDAPPPARRPDGEPIADAAGPRGHAASAVTVRFESVGYTYPGAAEPALRELSLEARPGTLTALVGEIGSGKSTAMAVVPRLIDPSAGRVIVGGRDVRSWPLDELRGAIGYVPQEPVLFSTTVEENIRLGRGWLSDDDVSMAIGASRLGPDVAIWADGLATRVGSRGIRLSGGQKQRVALARALAGRPSILLLDDCTASLDAETEDEVWRAIVGVLPSCVTLVVTHRPATLERAHHIVVLERGRPVEAGDFAALVRLGTRFSSLYVRWKLESEPAPSGSEAAGA